MKIGTVVKYKNYFGLYLGAWSNRHKYGSDTICLYLYKIANIDDVILDSNKKLFDNLYLDYVKHKIELFIQMPLDKTFMQQVISLNENFNFKKVFSIQKDKVIMWYSKNRLVDNNLPYLVELEDLLNLNQFKNLDLLENRVCLYKELKKLYNVDNNDKLFVPLYVKEFKPYHIYTYPVSGKTILSLPNNKFIYCPFASNKIRAVGLWQVLHFALSNYKLITERPNVIDINEDIDIAYENMRDSNCVVRNQIRDLCKEKNLGELV